MRKVKWKDGICSGWSCGVSSGYLYSTTCCEAKFEPPHHSDGYRSIVCIPGSPVATIVTVTFPPLLNPHAYPMYELS